MTGKNMTESYNSIALDFKNTKSDIAFTKLYQKMRPSLKNYIRNMTKDADVTEDLLARTFIKIYEKIDGYDTTFSITTWAYTIAKRECLRWIKRERNPRVSLSYLSEFGSEVTSDDDTNKVSKNGLNFEDEDYKPEEKFLEEDNLLQYRYDTATELIKSLKPMYRDILVDIMFNKMKYKDVAFKYDDELQKAKLKYDREISKTDDEEKLEKIQKEYNAVFKKSLQRVKNRVRRGKSLVASELEELFPNIKIDMDIREDSEKESVDI
jgi:RNA polymerase sigma-70 factor (ECF subfamily)